MKEAVYPPAEYADSPVRKREWLSPGWAVMATAEDGAIASYTGVVVTEGLVDGTPVTIGGIGGVATHPEHRGLGLAAESIERAVALMEERGVDFALLVCDTRLIPYYGERGWRRFGGTTLVTQSGQEEVFTFNEVMVRNIGSAAPDAGTIDLLGPPW